LRPDLVGELITAVDVVGNLELCVTEENNAPMVDKIANIPIGDKAPYPYSKLFCIILIFAMIMLVSYPLLQ
jgi:hypothetical protein